MFGGLTKTSSRIAIAAALGLMLGGFAFKATPAQAADLGGDCCADLEERVAELEATTVRKGNKKVSVTLSGWVVKSINWWDDGDIDHLVVGDKDYDLGTRFAITGSAQIAPGWTAGYNVTVLAPSTVFGFGADQFDDLGGTYGAISTLYSYIFIKSDTWGTLNWGHLSPASDNPAVLADISGTVIESNAVFFEGNGFFLRPKGNRGNLAGLSQLTWGDFLTCNGFVASPGIGADCFGNAQPAVRYDSPTWGGFRFETSYGKNQAGQDASIIFNEAQFEDGNQSEAWFDQANTSDYDFWDIAVFYTGDWNSIKVSAAAAYTWIETSVADRHGTFRDVDFRSHDFCEAGLLEDADCGRGSETDLFQVGASIMHKPSGLGIYGLYQHEDNSGKVINFGDADCCPQDPSDDRVFNTPDSDVWYVKPFWRKAWSPIGATVLYGEYGEYQDQFGGLVGQSLSDLGAQGDPYDENLGIYSVPGCQDVYECFVTGSEVQRWGLGLVQEIDPAAMHLWVRWQHQELEVDFLGVGGKCGGSDDTCKIHSSFDDWDLFQAGGVIFF
jgi:hypothetical protein